MKLLRKISYTLPRLILISIFAAYAVFALMSYFDYFERYLFPLHFIQGEVQTVSDKIFIGPYPHFDEMKKLQKETGISVVASLLNTSLPPEKALLRRERKVAERLGIELHSYPMSYLDLNGKRNLQASNDLIALIKNLGDNKIYIHCYLGRHRVIYLKDRLIKEGLIEKDYFAINQ
jgi:hypothetical protein